MKRYCLAALLLCLGNVAAAHPLAPALLQIEQTGAGSYDVLWRQSALQPQARAPQPVLPTHCQRQSEPQMRLENNNAISQRWQVDCGARGLLGQVLAVEGLDNSGSNAILRFVNLQGDSSQALVDAAQSQWQVTAPQSGWQVLQRYLALGVEHLLLGPDHLLFLLGLLLLVNPNITPKHPKSLRKTHNPRPSGLTNVVTNCYRRVCRSSRLICPPSAAHAPSTEATASLSVTSTPDNAQLRRDLPNIGCNIRVMGWRRLILTLTAFTIGHSITLSLASLELLALPQSLTELGIAISIVLLARELLSKRPSWLGRYPMFMAGGFGLLHGLGFAGVLGEIGLPQTEVVSALLGFNLGIELAQLLIMAVVIPVTVMLAKLEYKKMSRTLLHARALPAYVMGALAVMWCIERFAQVEPLQQWLATT